MNGDCEYVRDGRDTDGTVWYRCTTHDELAPSQDAPCAGYVPIPYLETEQRRARPEEWPALMAARSSPDAGLALREDQCFCEVPTVATNEYGETWCALCGERLLFAEPEEECLCGFPPAHPVDDSHYGRWIS